MTIKKPSDGMNKKRSPKGQFIRKKKLEVSANVLKKIKAPNPIIVRFQTPIIKTTISKKRISTPVSAEIEEKPTKGI